MNKTYIFSFIFLFCFGIINAQNFENVKIVSIYDGDTFKVNLPCSEDIFCKDISVRVNGIDTPEIKTKDSCEKKKAKEAQALAKDILGKGPVILKNCQRDKYFRLLCDIIVLGKNQGYNLSEELLAQNLAVEYHGETKADVNWCKYAGSKKQKSTPLDDIWEQILDIFKEIFKFIKNFK